MQSNCFLVSMHLLAIAIGFTKSVVKSTFIVILVGFFISLRLLAPVKLQTVYKLLKASVSNMKKKKQYRD